MTEKLKETIVNLIALHEAHAPLEDIDAAIIEARRMLDNLFQASSGGNETMNDDEKIMKLAQWLLDNSPYYFEQAHDEAASLMSQPDFDFDEFMKD